MLTQYYKSLRENLIFYLSLITLFFLIFFTLSYSISRSISYYRAKISYYNQKKNSALQEQIDCSNLKKQIKEQKTKLNKKLESLVNFNQGNSLRNIIDIIFQSNLNISQFKPDLIFNKNWYNKIYLNLEVTGSYYGIYSFFYKLNNLNFPVSIRNCLLSTNKESINCKCSLKFYLFKII